MGKENRAAAQNRSNPANAKKKATANNDKKKTILIVVALLLVVVLMASVIIYTKVLQSGYLLRREVAAESENYTVDGAMMAYFFKATYGQYSGYASYLGIDTSVSLKEQTSIYGTGTWFDYFMEMAKSSVEQTLALCEAANAAGVKLENEDIEDIDLYFDEMKAAADSYGYASFEQFLALNYGTGIKEKDLRNAMMLTELANKYSTQYKEALSYTEADWEAYYEENKDSFNSVDFLLYTVKVSDFEEKDEAGTVLNAAEARVAAEAKANLLAGATDADNFKALVSEYLTTDLGKTLESANTEVIEMLNEDILKGDGNGDEFDAWAFADSTAAGATQVIAGNDTSYDVYYLVSKTDRDETALRNIRHILFATDSYESADAAKVAAEAAYADWEAAGFSEEKFLELNDLYNDDTGSVENGGLYEDVAPGEMVTEFDAWLFDSARVAGDYGLVESADYGWHIMSYVGESDMTVWQRQTDTALSNAAYSEMIEANSGNIVFHADVLAHIAA